MVLKIDSYERYLIHGIYEEWLVLTNILNIHTGKSKFLEVMNIKIISQVYPH